MLQGVEKSLKTAARHAHLGQGKWHFCSALGSSLYSDSHYSSLEFMTRLHHTET